MARSQLLQRPSRRGDPPARAHRRSRGSATLGAASPLLLADPHDQAGGHLPAGSRTLGGFVQLPKKPGRRGEEDPLPPVPGKERKLERAGVGLHFTPKFPC